MRVLMLCILLIFTSHHVLAQDGYTIHDNDTISNTAKALNTTYPLITNDSDCIEIVQYFNLFPNNFRGLFDLFGANDGINGSGAVFGKFYNYTYMVIPVFKATACINDTLVMKKLVDISLGGIYGCPAIEYFHDLLYQKFSEKLKLGVYTLSRLPDKDIYSFSMFYYEGLDRPDQKRDAEAQLKIIKTCNKRVFTSMAKANREICDRDMRNKPQLPKR